MIRRIAGVIAHPRATLAGLVQRPVWAATWFSILVVWGLCGGWLLSTDVGHQALVDERVRVIESFGGSITDAEYAALQANPPWWVYFTSGGRLLLTPIVTFAVAIALWVVIRLEGHRAGWSQVLAVSVHASVVLLLGQVLATPLHYVRESLTSPFNLGNLLPLMDAGSLVARFFGTLDLFAIWWAGWVAVALSVMTSRSVLRYAVPLIGFLVGVAALLATVMVVMGGGS